MAGFFTRGRTKPPLGAQVNPDHPFAQGVRVVFAFNEGFGTPNLLRGSAAAVPLIAVRSPIWGATAQGIAGRFPTAPPSSDGWKTLTPSISWLPTSACTVACIKRKLDTTNRQAAVVSANGSGTWSGAASFMTLAPFSDGTVYWDYGGTGGANRLTAAGLSFSITSADRWIFTAGPTGSAIWQNGIKVASQATPIVRVSDAADVFWINNSGEAAAQGDICDINFVQVSGVQWTDDICRWWTVEPYAHLYSETARTYQFMAALPAGFATTHHSAFGAQKPSRRRTHR